MPGPSANVGFSIGSGLRLGGGSSPSVAGAGVTTGSSVSPSQAAYGAGSTEGSSGGWLGTSPGHFAFYAGTTALVLLFLVRRSLPR